jgi:large subunit ribosomal protein L30
VSAAAKSKTGKLRVTLKRSTIGRKPNQGRIAVALGLHKVNQSVIHDDSPMIRGMINKIPHLVEVESVKG